MKKAWLFLPLLALLLLLALLALLAGGLVQERAGAVLQSARPIPAFSLPALEGDARLGATDLAGGVYLVNFFASWCAPCREEMAFFHGLNAPGLRLIGIAYKDKPHATQKFLRETGNPYARVAYDADGMGAIEWGVTGVPESFLIDARGQIIAHHAGPVTPQIWQSRFAPALAGGR